MRIALLWLLLISSSAAQVPWTGERDGVQVTQTQVTFQTADAAEVAPDGERVSILAQGLDPGKAYGVNLHTDDPQVKWIEVHDAKQPFPPRVQEPYKAGQFIIRGTPGQIFWVSLRGDGPPGWIEVKITPTDLPPEPEPEPEPEPDPDDYQHITDLSRKQSTQLADPQTASAIRAAITAACDQLAVACKSGQCPVLAECKRVVVAAVDAAPKSGRVDWYGGWRVPISNAINSLELRNPSDYIAAMRAAAEGL